MEDALLSRLRWRRTPGSSWVGAVAYSPGFVFIRTTEGTVYAYQAPAWVFGLICAAVACDRSVGRLYNRIVKGRPSLALGVA